MPGMSPREVVEELFRRTAAGDVTAIDELIADDMVSHAGGPQGRDGLKQIMAVIESDLGAGIEIDHHHLVAEGDLLAHHMTMHGRHRASTMPLLKGTPASDAEVAWTFMHSGGWWTDGSSSTGRAGMMSVSSFKLGLGPRAGAETKACRLPPRRSAADNNCSLPASRR